MVVHLVHLLEVGVGEGEPVELLFAQAQVVEFVFEDDARVEQSVGNGGMALCFLLFGERYLCQIVFSLVGVVLGTVGRCRGQGVLNCLLGSGQGVL